MASIELSINPMTLVRILVRELVDNDLFIVRLIETFYLRNGWNVYDIFAAPDDKSQVITADLGFRESLQRFIDSCAMNLKVWCCTISNEERDNFLRIHVEVAQTAARAGVAVRLLLDELSDNSRRAITILNDRFAQMIATTSNTAVALEFPTLNGYYNQQMRDAPIRDRMLHVMKSLHCISDDMFLNL